MVARMRHGRHGGKPGTSRGRLARRILFEAAIAIIITGIFALKIVNYVDPRILLSSVVGQTIDVTYDNTVSAIENLPIFNDCPGELTMKDISGGYVCAGGDSRPGKYDAIYTSYPLVGTGRESIYTGTNDGSIAAANNLLHNRFDLPRYPPAQFHSLPNWSENLYDVPYWRLEFYSLRPSLNLLYAFRMTGKTVYARQLLRLDLGFIAAEDRSRWAWADPHAVAFRCMSLVDTWWKLRQGHQLPEAASAAILRELEKTGQFLANPNHYQPGENHAANEAAALYGLAVAFPTLPHAQQWLAVAKQRFQWQLDEIIDADGQLIENSPFYDFYILEKYWQIYDYSRKYGYPISADFGSRLRSMLNFATYILQPNSQLPLMGASLETTINDSGVYAEMAASDPYFRYVLTHGAQGSPPPEESVFFPASALTVMRSSWGSGAAFAGSTYLTYYAGKYRTAHSDLDALSLTLYGDGGGLLPDPGLYTYAPGAYHNYFHGTASHNAVVVDGKSQAEGNGTAEPLVTKDGLTYQSAESSLYGGVTHRRLVMMIDPDHVLVVDRLSSARVHDYQQMFHLFPGARLSKAGLTVSGTGGSPRREITIQQLLPGGITERDAINERGARPDGLCSEAYGHLLPCYAIRYSASGKDASFVTLLTIGAPRRAGFAIKVSSGGQHLQIIDGHRDLGVSLGESTAIAPAARASDPSPPPVRTSSVTAAVTSGDWSAAGAGTLSAGPPDGTGQAPISLSSDSGSPALMQNNVMRVNLERQNARLRLKVSGRAGLSELRLRLSNDHWAKWVTTSLLDDYTKDDAGQWVNLFLGRSGQWGQSDGWQAPAPGFDWADVDGMEIEMVTRDSGGRPATVSLGGLTLIPGQTEGKLVFVFDDGLQSIVAAASYLHRSGMAGNIAMTGKYADYPTVNYLNLFQLKSFQNSWGWDIVNEGQQDYDAVKRYYDHHDLTGYARDIVQQAAWLEANGLNSAPNWFIYPNGAVNTALERVVGRYYMFARVAAGSLDAYPYGDPREITDLETRYPEDGESGATNRTSPAEILSAVHQALIQNMTLILTFHGIHSESGGPPGYPLALFKKVVDGVRGSGIKVMTLSQLDRSNGVAVRNRIYVTNDIPSQLTVHVTSRT
jgi:Heparinase II/III-like protein/Heparinase II/III N-terminus